MIDCVIGFAKERKINFRENVDLSRISTVRIGPLAPVILYPKTPEELIDTTSFLKYNSVKNILVGGLSNTLVFGKVFDGAIISMQSFSELSLQGNSLSVGAGVLLSKAITFAAERSFGGMEHLRWIPGTTGAAIFGNAGAGGTEVCDFLTSVTVFDRTLEKVLLLNKREIIPQYRKTSLQKDGDIVLSATFDLVESNKFDIFSAFDAAKQLRIQNQPLDKPSLGSVFKRCDGISAGYYVDKAGLKGVRVGGAQVSEKHAGFFTNIGGATAEDYYELIELVKARVLEIFSIQLEEEIKIIR